MPFPPITQVASDAMHPYGAGFFVAPFGTVAPAAGVAPPGPWSEIGKLVRQTTPENAAGDTKTTHLKSPDKAHEYIPGYFEGGTQTLRLHYSRATMLAVMNGLVPLALAEPPDFYRLVFLVQFPDGGLVYFAGYLKGTPVEVGDGDDPIGIDVTIKVSGKVVYI